MGLTFSDYPGGIHSAFDQIPTIDRRYPVSTPVTPFAPTALTESTLSVFNLLNEAAQVPSSPLGELSSIYDSETGDYISHVSGDAGWYDQPDHDEGKFPAHPNLNLNHLGHMDLGYLNLRDLEYPGGDHLNADPGDPNTHLNLKADTGGPESSAHLDLNTHENPIVISDDDSDDDDDDDSDNDDSDDSDYVPPIIPPAVPRTPSPPPSSSWVSRIIDMYENTSRSIKHQRTWDYVGGSAFAIAGHRQFAVATSSPYGQKNETHYYVLGTANNAFIYHRTLRQNDDILGSYAEMIQQYNKAREAYIDPVVDIKGNVTSQDGS